jgi:selenocysteine-specific elongation factor
MDLILGTAGHIDHGKTSLIRALTGVDTDRLPEEKRRGITIELGFAHLTVGAFRFGIVDVPGHERFIRNMLCGATGMDLALLVVAADDSVKQQTREHLDILRLLDLKAGVIALTKSDLVERAWADLVTEEVRQLVAGTFLADAAIVETSVTTGQGLDQLREELERAAERVTVAKSNGRSLLSEGIPVRGAKEDQQPFRMPIDRTFSVAGHGTVVTGSVTSGVCRVGDELMIEPGSIAVRVRGLQNHDQPVESVQRGQRAAINLVGVHHNELGRGQELASSGHLLPSKLLTVMLDVLHSSPRPVENRMRIKLHVGTAEISASIRLLSAEALNPGESGPAQLFLAQPAVTVWNQPFVVRSESPTATLGGGRILDPDAQRIRKADATTLEMIAKLSSPEVIERASSALFFAGLRPWQPRDLARTAGISAVNEATNELRAQGHLREIQISPTRTMRIHRLVLEQLYSRIEAALKKLHEAFPLRLAHDPATLVAGFQYLGSPAILDAALQDMARAKRLLISERGISLAGFGPKLSVNEQRLMTQLVDTIRAAGFQPPTVKECQQQATKHQNSVPQLLKLAAANGELVEVSADFYLHAEVEREGRRALTAGLATEAGLTVSEIREVLNTSRKYAVPYCEYLDRSGFTVRNGDARKLKVEG